MPVNDAALLKKQQAQLGKLRASTAAALVKVWNATYTSEPSFTKKAAVIVGAAQNRAVDTQLAYLTSLLGKFDFDREDILGRAGIDLRQPFIAYALALKNKLGDAAALEAGRLRTAGVADSAVTWAARAANTAADDRVVGWTRVLSGDACDFCQTVSTQRYHTAESASFGHLRCNCGVAPIIGTRDPGRVLNRAAETAA